MRRRGFEVDVADGAKEAIQMVAREHYDVLVTDLSMPGMDGITLIDTLRGRGFTMPCVVATGYGELYVRGEYALAGPKIHVVEKPWNDAEVAALLHRLALTRPAVAVQAS